MLHTQKTLSNLKNASNDVRRVTFLTQLDRSRLVIVYVESQAEAMLTFKELDGKFS